MIKKLAILTGSGGIRHSAEQPRFQLAVRLLGNGAVFYTGVKWVMAEPLDR